MQKQMGALAGPIGVKSGLGAYNNGYRNGCPPGYATTPDGRCVYTTQPSGMWPSSSYPASGMVNPGPVVGTTIAIGKPSGTF